MMEFALLFKFLGAVMLAVGVVAEFVLLDPKVKISGHLKFGASCLFTAVSSIGFTHAFELHRTPLGDWMFTLGYSTLVLAVIIAVWHIRKYER